MLSDYMIFVLLYLYDSFLVMPDAFTGNLHYLSYQEKYCWSVWEPFSFHPSKPVPSCSRHWRFWSKIQYRLTWGRYVHLLSILWKGKKAYSPTWFDWKVVIWSWAKWRAHVSYFLFLIFSNRNVKFFVDVNCYYCYYYGGDDDDDDDVNGDVSFTEIILLIISIISSLLIA